MTVTGHETNGIAVIGTRTRTYQWKTRTINAHIQHCVAWCACGWRSRTVESQTRAYREFLSHLPSQAL